jgi:catechol 2,3-dioxygenase-like lactoylglutathione lyase family enzyme
MSTAQTASSTSGDPKATADLKLEVVVLPVADVERSKEFYANLGWRLDADFAFDSGFKLVQFTPPGSATSIQFGTHLTTTAPGSVKNTYLVVSDIEAARDEIAAKAVEISEVFHPTAPGSQFGGDGNVTGPSPDRGTYRSFATFADPDGNTWLLQEITNRLPGRIDSGQTSYASVADLVDALKRAAAAHGEHEQRNGGEYDQNWPDWYAAYMVAEQAGMELPQ